MPAKCTLCVLLIVLLATSVFSQFDDNVYIHHSPHPQGSTSDDDIHQIIEGTIELFQFLRNDIGVYADAARFEGAQFHPCSIASVGMGLVSLCIADKLDLIENADAFVLQTLNAMSGNVAGFEPARNPVNGFFRHWIEMDTGARAWNSEYSSIDTGILVSGALFCKNYFSENLEIARLADALFLSIDWNRAVVSSNSGKLYMTFDEQGRGALQTSPFNEYMIVAWLANNDPRANSRTRALWDNHYENAADLPTSSYSGISLLTDSPGHYLSNFVIQFPYYLCHHFTVRQDYVTFLQHAMQVDKLWWAEKSDKSYIWGTGAGASKFSGSGYNADNFNYNPGTVCSPHILAGFSPVDSNVIADVKSLWSSNTGVYRVPGSEKKFLWRFSAEEPEWRAADVQGVDISTLLFGLAAHPSVLGKTFFETHNDFDFPGLSGIGETNTINVLDFNLDVIAYPNPFNATTTIQYQLDAPSDVRITIYDLRGQRVADHTNTGQHRGTNLFHLDASNLTTGVYVARVQTPEATGARKIVLTK